MPFNKICSRVPKRWIIVLACFFGVFNTYEVQVCLSVAIVKMVQPKNFTINLSNNDTNTTEEIDVSSFDNKNFSRKVMTFDWDEKTQSYILSAYYWGGIISFMLAGLVLDKLGAKRTMGASIFIVSFFTILVPKSVERYGAISLIAMRFLAGIGGGLISPTTTKLFSRWIPKDERSFAASWAYAGGSVGGIVSMVASGTIIERFDAGWPAIFYVYGSFGLLLFCLHCVICYESPDKHPYISKSELEMLKRKMQSLHRNPPPTPWNQIVRSKPVWAILFALTGNAWCQMIMANYTPKFINRVLHVNMETNGYISSIPHIGSLVLNCVLSKIGDQLIVKKIASTACVRKVGNSFASVGTGLLLVIVTYIGNDATLIVGLYVFATILFSIHHVSTLVNILDLTPNFAGAIQGFLLAGSMILSQLSPYAAGLLLHTQTVSEWRSIFFMVFGVGAFTNLVFVIYGKAEVQEWNDPQFLKRESTEIKDQVKDHSECFAML